jgi:hypothetical protein
MRAANRKKLAAKCDFFEVVRSEGLSRRSPVNGLAVPTFDLVTLERQRLFSASCPPIPVTGLMQIKTYIHTCLSDAMGQLRDPLLTWTRPRLNKLRGRAALPDRNYLHLRLFRGGP